METVPFKSWPEVLAYARTGGPLYYQAPLDRLPTHLLPVGKSKPAPYSYKVQARTIRIWPPGSVGRGRFRTSDPFNADSGHLARFSHPAEGVSEQRRVGAHRDPVDEHAATELVMYIENESDLSPDGPSGQGRSTLLNMLRKWKKGTYDSTLAVRQFEYLTEAGAKRYAKEFGSSPKEWSTMFTPATRHEAAKQLEASFRSSAENGEYDRIATEHRSNGSRPVRAVQSSRMDSFTQQYFETALWSSTDELNDQGGAPLDDNYSISDIAPETRAKMIADCTDFQQRYRYMLDNAYGEGGIDSERAGHNFWLSRNGHGAGFFDDDLDELQEAAKSYGEFNLYVGDDGQIHGS